MAWSRILSTRRCMRRLPSPLVSALSTRISSRMLTVYTTDPGAHEHEGERDRAVGPVDLGVGADLGVADVEMVMAVW